jgi:hypothetical protein
MRVKIYLVFEKLSYHIICRVIIEYNFFLPICRIIFNVFVLEKKKLF